MKTVQVATRSIGPASPCYIIAEIGGNFVRFEDGRKLVDLAAEVGADAVKLQTFRADTVTSRQAVFDMENTGKISQYDHFKEYEIDEQLHREIFDYATSKGLEAFSTPSHPSDVDLLEKLDVPAHKIGSDDTVNVPLLKHTARTGKPVILSTGMCTMSEVQRAVDAILEEGNERLVVLHCTTNYPTHPESVNLLAMQTMQRALPLPVGYSDHTLGIDTCYAAAVLGARVLEFHFTYDKGAHGPDHMLSKDPAETAELIAKVRNLPVLLGDGVKRPAASEMNTRTNNRKSLVVNRDVPKGGKLSLENLTIKRPGYGIPCEHYYSVLGKTVSRDLSADDVLTWPDLT